MNLSQEEFELMLTSHRIDISLYGIGVACSLDEFFSAVVEERKWDLFLRHGKLERVVNLVRISLRIRDSDNKLRELRAISGGSTLDCGECDLPLTITMRMPE